MKRTGYFVVFITFFLLLLTGCRPKETVTMLDSVSTFYSDCGRVEATVRELTQSGRKAEVRILFTNVSGGSMDSIDAQVHFLSDTGEILSSQPIHLQFETALEDGSRQTCQAVYQGKDAKNVVKVVVTELDD